MPQVAQMELRKASTFSGSVVYAASEHRKSVSSLTMQIGHLRQERDDRYGMHTVTTGWPGECTKAVPQPGSNGAGMKSQ